MAIVAVAMMAGGCSSKDEMQTQNELVPIRLTASVGMEAVTRGADGNVIETDAVVTRGLQDNALASSEKVYVWANETGSSSWDYLKAWTLTAGSTGLTGSTKYYPADGTAITMNAVHGNFSSEPSEDNTAIGTLTHSVVADQSAAGGYEKSDLLFGTATGSKASTTAENIAFTHKLSKIEVNLTAGYGYDATDLATAEVHLNNVLPTVTIDPTDGSLGSASGTAVTITPRMDATSGTYEAVIPPQTFTSPDAVISVTTTKDSKTLTSTVPNTVATFAGNTKYVYNVKVRILDPGIPLAKVTNAHLGWVVASNGLVYETKIAADEYSTGKAMIAYISSRGHGLAYATEDASGGAQTTRSAHSSAISALPAIGSGVWRLPSNQDYQYMYEGCGGDPHTKTVVAGEAYNVGTFLQKLNAIGCGLNHPYYWTSTIHSNSSTYGWNIQSNGSFAACGVNASTWARGVLAF